jgi:hypothetical protein
MVSLTPILTLCYYLSKTGFPKFQEWFLSIDFFAPLRHDILHLIVTIENSTWYEDQLRKDCFNKIRELLTSYIEQQLNYNPDTYFQRWIDSIQQYCFQGGYGHKIQYSGNYPHHWCVRPEHYEKVKKIPEQLEICAVIANKFVNIAEKAEEQYWGN